MGEPAFDAADYVRFDLRTGAIGSRDDEDLVLVPRALLGAPLHGGELAHTARALGETRGVKFAAWAATSSSSEPLGLDALTRGVDGALAVLGFGRTEIDVRGDALLFRVRGRGETHLSEALAAFLGGFLAGFISAIDPTMPFEVVYLGPDAGVDAGEAVFFAGNGEAVARISQWIKGGEAPYSAVERLHREGGRA
jgi:hypothetical protein